MCMPGPTVALVAHPVVLGVLIGPLPNTVFPMLDVQLYVVVSYLSFSIYRSNAMLLITLCTSPTPEEVASAAKHAVCLLMCLFPYICYLVSGPLLLQIWKH